MRVIASIDSECSRSGCKRARLHKCVGGGRTADIVSFPNARVVIPQLEVVNFGAAVRCWTLHEAQGDGHIGAVINNDRVLTANVSRVICHLEIIALLSEGHCEGIVPRVRCIGYPVVAMHGPNLIDFLSNR